MAGAVTNELLLEHMKAMRAELAILTRQNRELRDRLTEVHAAVVALRRDQATDAEVINRSSQRPLTCGGPNGLAAANVATKSNMRRTSVAAKLNGSHVAEF